MVVLVFGLVVVVVVLVLVLLLLLVAVVVSVFKGCCIFAASRHCSLLHAHCSLNALTITKPGLDPARMTFLAGASFSDDIYPSGGICLHLCSRGPINITSYYDTEFEDPEVLNAKLGPTAVL